MINRGGGYLVLGECTEVSFYLRSVDDEDLLGVFSKHFNCSEVELLRCVVAHLDDRSDRARYDVHDVW